MKKLMMILMVVLGVVIFTASKIRSNDLKNNDANIESLIMYSDMADMPELVSAIPLVVMQPKFIYHCYCRYWFPYEGGCGRTWYSACQANPPWFCPLCYSCNTPLVLDSQRCSY
jgi:hypothetical protein